MGRTSWGPDLEPGRPGFQDPGPEDLDPRDLGGLDSRIQDPWDPDGRGDLDSEGLEGLAQFRDPAKGSDDPCSENLEIAKSLRKRIETSKTTCLEERSERQKSPTNKTRRLSNLSGSSTGSKKSKNVFT